MYRIGEFSRIARVTIDTLRHYDALGLLKAARVDRSTGYRYYAADQLQDLNRIIALKEVGLSLEEISRILQNQLTADELRGMLKAQLVLTESAIETAQSRRERILNSLNDLNLNENIPSFEVVIKSIDALTVAAIREIVPTVEQVPQYCDKMFNMIAEWMVSNGLPIGTPMTIYHDESYSTENIDTECAFFIPDIEVDKVPKPITPIMIRQMKAVPEVATIVFTGDFRQESVSLRSAYSAIVKWIEDHGYRIVGAPRELYHGPPENGELTAEIQFPVEKCDLMKKD